MKGNHLLKSSVPKDEKFIKENQVSTVPEKIHI
jgi:hypothetical protein